MRFLKFASVALLLTACAESTTIDLADNQFILQTSAEAACGRIATTKVANKMAAVETLRRGYDRFVILGASSANNTQTIVTGPTYATTYGRANVYGNTAYGNSNTYFGGQSVLYTGTHDQDLNVLMLRTGERGYATAIRAKQVLGENWKEITEKGINTCS